MNTFAVTLGGMTIHRFTHTDLENMRRLLICASRGDLRGMDRVLEYKLRLFG